jgi:outer membrane immunogenic protein
MTLRRTCAAALVAAGLCGLSQTARGSDAAMRLKTAHAAPVYHWTGFYLGGNVGAAWGRRSVDYAANDPAAAVLFLPANGGLPLPLSFNTSGAVGGLQLGYNWQFSKIWLFGIEADFDWSGMKGGGSSHAVPPVVIPITENLDESLKWFGTVRARLGYLPSDRLLAYATGGFAYGRVVRTGSYANNAASYANNAAAIGTTTGGFSFLCAAASTCFTGSSSGVAIGWTLGGGLEYALTKELTLKGEYLYVSLDGQALTRTALEVLAAGAAPASFNANFDRTKFNVARIGLNYRF